MCELAKKLLCSSGKDGAKSHFTHVHSLSKLVAKENFLSETICLGLCFYGWTAQKINSKPQLCDHSPGPSLALLP